MSGTTARTGHYLLVEMPTPEEFLCGGRFRHPSRYRRKPSLSSLHQNRKMSSFKTAAIKIYQTKSCRIRSESNPPKPADQRDTVLGVAKGHKSKAGTALDKILFRIWYLCWNLTRIKQSMRRGRPTAAFLRASPGLGIRGPATPARAAETSGSCRWLFSEGRLRSRRNQEPCIGRSDRAHAL